MTNTPHQSPSGGSSDVSMNCDAALAPDYINAASSPEDVKEAWMIIEQERLKLKKERDSMAKERAFLLEASPLRQKRNSSPIKSPPSVISSSSQTNNKSSADENFSPVLSPIRKDPPTITNFKLRSCLCGRESECHALSTSFYCIQDPRCLYATLPKGGLISTLRLSYLLHILPPGGDTSTSPSLFGGDEEDEEQEETRYIALHHFHPEIIKWSYNKSETNPNLDNSNDQKVECKLPKYISKHDLEELDIDFSEYDRADELDFEDMSDNDEDRVIGETNGDGDSDDGSNKEGSDDDGDNKQQKEAFYVVPNYPFELATMDLQQMFRDRGMLEEETEKEENKVSIGRKGVKSNLTTLFTDVHKYYENETPEDMDKSEGSEKNSTGDDDDGSGSGEGTKFEQEISKLLTNRIAFPPLPSEHQPSAKSSSLANTKVSSADMHMELLAYESKRRAVYSFLSDSSFKKKWQTFVEHHIRAGLHEVARTKRFILGLTSANGAYAQAIKAITNDVFLDDFDHEVVGERKQKNLASKRNTNSDDEFNETYMGDALYALIQSQTTLGNGFQQSSDILREDVCEKMNEFYMETKTKADEVENLAAAIFSDLQIAESKVYTTWKAYDSLMVGEDLMGGSGQESLLPLASTENAPSGPSSSRNISFRSTGEDSADASNGDDSNNGSDTEEKKPASSSSIAKSGTSNNNTTTESDSWIYQMHYRVAVTYQALAWKLRWKELHDEVANNELDRRMKLEDLLRLFVSRHLRLFAGIQSTHTPMLQGLVGKFTAYDEIENDLGATFQGLENLSANTVGVEESGITALESPMLNCDSKVVEVKTRMRWYRKLAVVSDNSFLHIFDIPIKEGGRLSPEDAFLSLLPSIDSEKRNGMAKFVLKSLTPWETYFLPRTTVKRSNKMPREVTLSESRAGVVRKTSTSTMRLRCDLPEEAVTWLISKGCLLPANEGEVSFPADVQDDDDVSLYGETIGSKSPPAKDIFKFLHSQGPDLETDDAE